MASEQPTSDPRARLLANKYRLLAKLGEGGMGSVWTGEHLELKAPVAIKLMDPQIATNEDMRARFLREARATAVLRSPHVVQILDYGVDESTAFIVMELLEGESLAQRLGRVGTLSPRQTVRVLTEVCRAMGRAHAAGIVHRDLKPDNIFLVHNDDVEIAKVLDFGIAKTTHALDTLRGKATESGTMLGTPYYMSPEQANGSLDVDPSSDIWALGVIAFECLTGKLPFDGATIGALALAICVHPLPVPSQAGPVPPGFGEWFTRACARDPQKRFATSKAAARALAKACAVELGNSSDEAETELTDVWNPKWSVPAPPNREPAFTTTSHASSSRGVRTNPISVRRSRWGWTVGVIAAVLATLGVWWGWGSAPEGAPVVDAASESSIIPPEPKATTPERAPVMADLPPAEAEPSTAPRSAPSAAEAVAPALSQSESVAAPPRASTASREQRPKSPETKPGAPANPSPAAKRKINLGI